MIEFTVYSTPAPAGSKKFVGMRGGRGLIVDASKKSRPWKNEVRQVAGDHMLKNELPMMRGAIRATFMFYRKRPQSHYKKSGGLTGSAPQYPITKPDLTKLVRGTEDALKGICWNDDAQVVAVAHMKLYGEPERVTIKLEEQR